MQEVLRPGFCALTLVESSVRVVLFCFLRLHCGLSSIAEICADEETHMAYGSYIQV